MTHDEERKFTLDYYYKTMKYGTYMAATPTDESLDSIVALQKRLGIKNPVSRDELHCTLVYSKKGDPNVRPYNYSNPMKATPESLELFSEDKSALVLVLESDCLHRRHEQLLEYGLAHTFQPYTPHITLSYDYQGEAMDEELLYDENGESVVLLEFGSEYSEPLDD